MFEELITKKKEIIDKIRKIDKKSAVEEYLMLIREKAELEKKLADKKIRFIELEKNKKERSRKEHIKFFVGGIIAKYYPSILELKSDAEIENTIKKVLKVENQSNNYFEINKDKFETVIRDGEEYLKLKKQI